MATINCYIPIKIKITGRPSDAQLEELGETLVRALTKRVAFAEQTIAARLGASPHTGAVDLVRGPFDPARYDPARDVYNLPSYDDGANKGVRVESSGGGQAGPGKAVRIEVFLAEMILIVFQDGGRPPFVFTLIESPALTAGQTYGWAYVNGAHLLSAPSQSVVIRFRGRTKELNAFVTMVNVPGLRVPARVYASSSEVKPPAQGGQPGGDERGEAAEPLHSDEGVMANNAALAGLFLEFLARYARLAVDKNKAANGLTADEVKAIVGTNTRAQTVTRYFTQAWKEYKVNGEDLSEFSILEEALLTQWDRGNFTALHNLLEIRKDREGLGLYKRNTPLRFYDESGMPVSQIGGGYRDPGYRATTPPTIALQIKITDRGLLQVFQAIKNVTVDEQIEIYQAAQGYVDNKDLLIPAVRDGWDGWGAVNKELDRQGPYLVAFLAGHLAATALKRSSDPKAKLIGLAIDGILKVLGRIFQIIFAGNLANLAFQCGRELSLIKREPGQPLDSLSQRHLNNAVVLMRELLVQLIAAGLTAAMLKVAESTAVTLTPKGGGGGGLVTAPAGAGGRVGILPGAAEGVGKPPPSGLPSFVPIPKRPQDTSLQSTGGGADKPQGGPKDKPPGDQQTAAPGGAGGPDDPTRPSNRPGDTPSERGRGDTPSEPQQQETGSQKEERILAQDRPTRRPNSAKFFSFEGGKSRSFRGFLSDLDAHIRTLKKQGVSDPVPNLNRTVSDQDAATFIQNNKGLNATWEAWSKQVATRLQAIQTQTTAARGDRVRIAELNRQRAAVEARWEELNDFEKGKVGNKRPDLLELFLDQNRGVVTDITQTPRDPLHNFKTRFYIEVLKAMTGWTDVTGVDYSEPTNQTPLF